MQNPDQQQEQTHHKHKHQWSLRLLHLFQTQHHHGYLKESMYRFIDDPFRLLENGFLFFCKDSAVFIFPTLLADFKDQIQNLESVVPLWTELYIAQDPSIFLLEFFFI